MCQKKPVNVTSSATFVVDTRKLQSLEDIKKDEFGIWNYSGSHPQAFRVSEEDGTSLWIEKCTTGATGSNVVHIRRLHCTRPFQMSDMLPVGYVISRFSFQPTHRNFSLCRCRPQPTPSVSCLLPHAGGLHTIIGKSWKREREQTFSSNVA